MPSAISSSSCVGLLGKTRFAVFDLLSGLVRCVHMLYDLAASAGDLLYLGDGSDEADHWKVLSEIVSMWHT